MRWCYDCDGQSSQARFAVIPTLGRTCYLGRMHCCSLTVCSTAAELHSLASSIEWIEGKLVRKFCFSSSSPHEIASDVSFSASLHFLTFCSIKLACIQLLLSDLGSTSFFVFHPPAANYLENHDVRSNSVRGAGVACDLCNIAKQQPSSTMWWCIISCV